ncbi:MAG TPA: NADP-dependent oxidoreductase [Hyphomonadaceae bacterium]
MPTVTSREWRLRVRPVGEPKSSDFTMATVESPEPKDGEVQVRNIWMTVDPYMRGRMNEARNYADPYELDKPMTGGAVGQVLASRDPGYRAGDLVTSMAGWREVFTSAPAAAGMTRLPQSSLPPQAFLGVAGMPGHTAWHGLLRIGEPKPGETVFVSGAAGAVGSLVGQIAKLKGCRVIGSAGGKEKCDWLKSIGFDEAIDYRAAGDVMGLIKAVKQAAPNGVDVYFDNVGGDHLTAAIANANVHARMPICGMISIYNATKPPPGPFNMGLIIGRRIKIQGFLIFDHAASYPEFLQDISAWISGGKIRYEETVMNGIEKAPDAFLALFSGGNTGKMLVKLA